jgi:hypothetical protein
MRLDWVLLNLAVEAPMFTRSLSLTLSFSLTLPVAAFSQSAIPTGDVWAVPSEQGGAYAVVGPIQRVPVPSGDAIITGDVWLIPQTPADTADPTLTVPPSNNDLAHTATVDPKTPN